MVVVDVARDHRGNVVAVTGVGLLDQLRTISLTAQEIAAQGLFEGWNDAEITANDRDSAGKDHPQNDFAGGVMEIDEVEVLCAQGAKIRQRGDRKPFLSQGVRHHSGFESEHGDRVPSPPESPAQVYGMELAPGTVLELVVRDQELHMVRVPQEVWPRFLTSRR